MAKTQLILVAEDEDNDFFLLKKAFAQHGVKVPLVRVRDGAEAIDYLAGNGHFGDRSEYPLPDLLILDLKMPRCSGLDVLRWVRTHPTLRPMVVVILSSSKETRDVNSAYHLGANSYLTKPNSYLDFIDMTRVLISYWLDWSHGPDLDGAPNRDPVL